MDYHIAGWQRGKWSSIESVEFIKDTRRHVDKQADGSWVGYMSFYDSVISAERHYRTTEEYDSAPVAVAEVMQIYDSVSDRIAELEILTRRQKET